VVALVLHHAGMEAVHRAIDGVPVRVEAGVADAREARHHAAQAGHGEAAFPVFFLFIGQRRDGGIEQHRGRHQRPVRVAGVGRARAEDHELQIHADLRRRQARAVDGMHGVEHVLDQQVEFIGVEGGHWLGHAQQARVAHLQDVADGHVSC
jgi:hypothetical protein